MREGLHRVHHKRDLPGLRAWRAVWRRSTLSQPRSQGWAGAPPDVQGVAEHLDHVGLRAPASFTWSLCLVNGLVVAQNWDALTSGTLENPIMVDEKSITQETLAWTGTLADGQPALGSEFCEDWDDDSGLLKLGGIGASASTDSTWSFFEHSGCGSEIHLYCVEQ